MKTEKFSKVTVGFLSAAAMSFALAACLPEPLEVDPLPLLKPELVVSTQIIPDQSLVVLLTHTIGALQASDDSDPEQLLNSIAVNDALVTVQGPLGIDTLNLLGAGVYVAVATRFQAGDTYSLYITSPSMGEAHATTQVRRRVTFTDVEAKLYYNGYADTLAQVTYTIADPAEPNWYMLNVQAVAREDLIENLLNPRAYTVLLADTKFNGGTYAERFVVSSRQYHPGDTVAVTLSNISEEYYRFIQLRVGNQVGPLELISEPVNYPTNVAGGRGYFNLYVPDVRFFILE